MVRRIGSLALAAFLAGCALGPHTTVHTPAEQASIQQAQAYFDGLGGFSAQFVQAGPGDQMAQGAVRFETGHLRLDYIAPARRLVVAGDGRLVVKDEATSSLTRASLAANPLGLLLAGPVRLSGAIDVTDVQANADALQLSLDRADNPAQGLLTLFFRIQPNGALLLSGLEAVDAEQHRTRFALSGQQAHQRFDPAIFTLPHS